MIEQTAALVDLRVWICVDGDDPTLSGYYHSACEWSNRIELHIGEPRMVGPLLNHYATNNTALEHDIVGFIGDDHRPVTPRWDLLMRETLERTGWGIAYGNDLLQGPNLPTAVFMTANIIRTTGVFVPRGLKHLFLDNYWRDLGERANMLTYRSDVIIEHLHPAGGKAEWDDGYRRVNAPEIWEHDEKAYRQFVESGELDRHVAIVVKARDESRDE